MWPVVFRVLRQYAPVITLPFAAVVGIIGYNIENWISDKYTPYNNPIEQSRQDRQSSEESLQHAVEVKPLKYSANVFHQNVAPSLK